MVLYCLIRLTSGLPAGLLVSPALLRVDSGIVYGLIVNVDFMDMLRYVSTVIDTENQVDGVSLPPEGAEVRRSLRI